MRFTSILAPLVALSAVSASVIDSSLTRRDSVDICISITIDLMANLNLMLNTRMLDAQGGIEICICISGLSAFIQSNPTAKLAAATVGEDAVTSALTSIIESNNPSTCTYPDNSTPSCTASNACAFTCNPPFVLSSDGTSCVLPASTKAKRSWQKTLLSAEAACLYDHEVLCPVWGHSSRAFECVDVQSDLFSCGGCTASLYDGQPAVGIDCSTIQGVSDVGCISGRCEVQKCIRGWSVGQNGSSCVRI